MPPPYGCRGGIWTRPAPAPTMPPSADNRARHSLPDQQRQPPCHPRLGHPRAPDLGWRVRGTISRAEGVVAALKRRGPVAVDRIELKTRVPLPKRFIPKLGQVIARAHACSAFTASMRTPSPARPHRLIGRRDDWAQTSRSRRFWACRTYSADRRAGFASAAFSLVLTPYPSVARAPDRNRRGETDTIRSRPGAAPARDCNGRSDAGGAGQHPDRWSDTLCQFQGKRLGTARRTYRRRWFSAGDAASRSPPRRAHRRKPTPPSRPWSLAKPAPSR